MTCNESEAWRNEHSQRCNAQIKFCNELDVSCKAVFRSAFVHLQVRKGLKKPPGWSRCIRSFSRAEAWTSYLAQYEEYGKMPHPDFSDLPEKTLDDLVTNLRREDERGRQGND